MSSKIDFTAKVRSEGKITIPVEIREQLSIEKGEYVQVSIHKSEWYEMLDWGTMDSMLVNFNAFPEQMKTYITTTYSCDSGGNKWGEVYV